MASYATIWGNRCSTSLQPTTSAASSGKWSFITADTVRIPDLSLVSAQRMRKQNVDERFQGAPDLAIEVVSPSNEPGDLILKAKQYLQTGAKLVWIVYPQIQMVYIYRPGERVEIREAGQVLDAPELLPGWSISAYPIWLS